MPPCPRVANRSRARPARTRPCSSWPPATGNCRAANPVPPFPARDSETCYTASLSPNTTRLDPKALHRTTARPSCPGRQPCRPAPYRTSVTCPQRTSLRAQPVPTGIVPPCRPPRRQPAAEQDPPYSPCRRRHHLDRYPVTRSTQLSLFCAFSSPKRHLLRIFSPKTTGNRPRPHPATRVHANILSREERNIFQILGPIGQNSAFDTLSIPCRYPSSEEFAATLRHNWTLFGHLRTESAYLRTNDGLQAKAAWTACRQEPGWSGQTAESMRLPAFPAARRMRACVSSPKTAAR